MEDTGPRERASHAIAHDAEVRDALARDVIRCSQRIMIIWVGKTLKFIDTINNGS